MLFFRAGKVISGRGASPLGNSICNFSIVLGEQIAVRVINLVTFIIVARYVLPTDLGLLALAWTFIYFIEVLSSKGLVSAFIQCEQLNNVRRSTFFWLCQISGILGALIVLIFGVFAESVYDQLGITSICSCLSFLLVFRMIGTAHRAILLREQRQSALASSALISNILSSGLGVYLAIKGYGIWALLYKNVAQALLESTYIIFVNPWKPQRVLDRSFATYLFRFSYPLVGAQLLRLCIVSIQLICVGSVLGLKMLGALEVARRLPDVALQMGQGLIGRFLFPLNAEKVRCSENLLFLYKRLSICAIIVSFIVLSIIYPLSPWIVVKLFGKQWSDLGFIFFLSCAVSNLSIYKVLIQSFLIALGQSRASVVDFYYMLGFTPLFLFALRWGLDEALMVTTISHLLGCIHLHFATTKSIQATSTNRRLHF